VSQTRLRQLPPSFLSSNFVPSPFLFQDATAGEPLRGSDGRTPAVHAFVSFFFPFPRQKAIISLQMTQARSPRFLCFSRERSVPTPFSHVRDRSESLLSHMLRPEVFETAGSFSPFPSSFLLQKIMMGVPPLPSFHEGSSETMIENRFESGHTTSGTPLSFLLLSPPLFSSSVCFPPFRRNKGRVPVPPMFRDAGVAAYASYHFFLISSLLFLCATLLNVLCDPLCREWWKRFLPPRIRTVFLTSSPPLLKENTLPPSFFMS